LKHAKGKDQGKAQSLMAAEQTEITLVVLDLAEKSRSVAGRCSDGEVHEVLFQVAPAFFKKIMLPNAGKMWRRTCNFSSRVIFILRSVNFYQQTMLIQIQIVCSFDLLLPSSN